MTQIINDFIDKNGFDAPYDIDDTCITSCTFDNGCLIGFCAIRGNELTGFVLTDIMEYSAVLSEPPLTSFLPKTATVFCTLKHLHFMNHSLKNTTI